MDKIILAMFVLLLVLVGIAMFTPGGPVDTDNQMQWLFLTVGAGQ